ncbi:MAG: hypothetical protein K2G01_05270 [Paramuribaculum sp.]|nr:hypothetical protein [Paramuribaculum sp.]
MKKYLYNSKNLIYSGKAKSFILSAFYFLAIIGLSAMTGCNDEDENDSDFELGEHMTFTYDYYRLVNPEMVYHAGSVFTQWCGKTIKKVSLSDKEFLGKSYLQINIEDKPTDMLIRVDGDVIWGYDPQSENEFKMYDFSKCPLEQGDSLTYRIYEVNNNYEITGIADYSNVLKISSSNSYDFMLGDSIIPKSRCTEIINYHDNIYEYSTIGHLCRPKGDRDGLYSYSIVCGVYDYYKKVDAVVKIYYTYFQYFGMERGRGLFYKDPLLDDEHPTCEVLIDSY